MARYGDLDKLLEHIKDLPTWWADSGGVFGKAMKYPDGMFDCDDVINSIENTPTADVVEVVRCKDCVWWEANTYGSTIGKCENPTNGLCYEYLDDTDYCSYGKRKEQT